MAGLPMVENCLSGYNSCMFAYGQVNNIVRLCLAPSTVYALGSVNILSSFLDSSFDVETLILRLHVMQIVFSI